MLDHSHEGASSDVERRPASSASQDPRVARSIWRAWARPTTAARKRAAFIASARVSVSISSFQVLRQQFTHENRPAADLRRQHPLAEERREMARAFDDALGLVGRHDRIGVMRRRRGRSLLHIHQAEVAVLAVGGADAQQDGVSAAGPASCSP